MIEVSKLGEAIVPKVTPLLLSKSADALAAAEVLMALRAPLASHALRQAFDAEKKAVLPTTTSESMQTMAHSNWKLCTPSSSARCCATCFACLRSA